MVDLSKALGCGGGSRTALVGRWRQSNMVGDRACIGCAPRPKPKKARSSIEPSIQAGGRSKTRQVVLAWA